MCMFTILHKKQKNNKKASKEKTSRVNINILDHTEKKLSIK